MCADFIFPPGIAHVGSADKVVSSDEQAVVEAFLKLKSGGAVDFDLMSEVLFAWSKKQISESN
jgi:hypothetical protein